MPAPVLPYAPAGHPYHLHHNHLATAAAAAAVQGGGGSAGEAAGGRHHHPMHGAAAGHRHKSSADSISYTREEVEVELKGYEGEAGPEDLAGGGRPVGRPKSRGGVATAAGPGGGDPEGMGAGQQSMHPAAIDGAAGAAGNNNRLARTTRWVMERRRTAETGEVEILEREVLEGGRI